ncbi:MAG TPA: alanine dehydrogenase [Oligoflexia bacterium]|nr:alanine dehydrogenase [Oligoflexia bacterium]HMP48030.1 alanine dehydrogenase [Oligoflexia bacterium]
MSLASIRIGIPKERKANEKRVALIPEDIQFLVNEKRALVKIETGAGVGSGYQDSDYKSAGANIVNSLEDVWKDIDLLVKVKEPAPEEYKFLRKGLMVFSFLHPAASKDLTLALLDSGVTGLDYDLVEAERSQEESVPRFPILEPMSRIAGRLSIQCGAQALLSQYGGPGILLDGIGGAPRTEVLVIGGGISGTEACIRANALSASVTVLDIKEEKLKALSTLCPGISTRISTPESVAECLKTADLIIGAVLIPGAKAPTILNRSLLKTCKKNAVFVDIAIDQGGISETSRPTTIAEPSYLEEGVIHLCVANMPSMAPRTATLLLRKETMPYITALCEKPLSDLLKSNYGLGKSLVCRDGVLTNKAIGESFGIKYEELG